MTRQILLLCCCYLLGFGVTNAQDPIFSQFYAAPLQLNPAFAGNTNGAHFALNYRNQWPSIPEAYITYAASYDQFVPSLNSGFGLMLLSDDAGQGLIKTNKVAGFFSYRLQVNRDFFLRLGTQISAVQTRLDWDRFIFLDQIDERVGPISPGGTPFPTEEQRPDQTSTTYLDISAGILAYSPGIYGGISIKHLNRPDESVLGINTNLNTGLPIRFTAHAGGEIKLTPGNKRQPASFISPNIMFVKQGDFGQINGGAYLSAGRVFGGTWYRHTFSNADAVIFLVGVQQGVFKIGYSYDWTISSLTLGDSGGSHEVSLIINLEGPENDDYNDCLKIF
ncbi:MAG: PorP/SprF family type IX secretion system membrane protein, partial [Bacteroidota bacterium]